MNQGSSERGLRHHRNPLGVHAFDSWGGKGFARLKPHLGYKRRERIAFAFLLAPDKLEAQMKLHLERFDHVLTRR